MNARKQKPGEAAAIAARYRAAAEAAERTFAPGEDITAAASGSSLLSRTAIAKEYLAARDAWFAQIDAR